MVALAILGMGLLVIAAALPAGAKYTKDSIDQVTGAAAAEYALELIEQNVCLRDRISGAGALGITLTRPAVLFQPRDPTTALPANGGAYEPLIKVRPLFVQNIIAASTMSGVTRGTELFDLRGTYALQQEVLVEAAICAWVTDKFGGTDLVGEYDLRFGATVASTPGPWLRPSLPSVALVYPPITADTSFDPNGFWNQSDQNYMYKARPVLQSIPHGGYLAGAETLKALERRIVWTAFYRRASYGGSDPTVYELIVVVSSRPTVGHRFPVQDPLTAGQQSGGTYAGIDSLAPIPWLVTFTSLPALPTGRFPNGVPDFGVGGAAPATLTFQCDVSCDGLLPVGSVFIPARNDDQPPLIPSANNRVHFGPLARSALPIYEVSQRPDATTVIVKYNGYYPVMGDPNQSSTWNPLSATNLWPVWVIPPVIEGVDASGNPAFSDRSPILAITRRYVKLRELP